MVTRRTCHVEAQNRVPGNLALQRTPTGRCQWSPRGQRSPRRRAPPRVSGPRSLAAPRPLPRHFRQVRPGGASGRVEMVRLSSLDDTAVVIPQLCILVGRKIYRYHFMQGGNGPNFQGSRVSLGGCPSEKRIWDDVRTAGLGKSLWLIRRKARSNKIWKSALLCSSHAKASNATADGITRGGS